MIEVNGIAHIQITAGDFAASKAFYARLLPFLGLTPVADGDGFYYCVGARTGFAVSPPDPEHRGARFVQRRVGLHHVCFRARSREDVDKAFAFVRDDLGALIVHGPQVDGFVPGYYSILFEDPDGVRLEVNHVPGRGVFESGGKVDMGQ
jgi:catechol 2,3-dioxygenase-like lactoylglutathione lyase family enzyme